MKSLALDKPRSETKQFAINVFANGAVMSLNILIGLWFTPYLIEHLGVATYGIVILAISLTSYMSIFNSSIDNAVGRFLTLDITSHKYDVANRTFNTALWSGLVIDIVLIPLVALLSFFTPQLFDIPLGQEGSARWLFAAVMGAYLLVLVRSIFTASTFAHNRLDIKNIIFASNTVVRVLLVVVLFTSAVPEAWHVGVATFSGGIVSLFFGIVAWRRLTPQLSISWRHFDKSRLRNMFDMSGWLLLNQVGSLLFLNVELIVINRHLGAEIQGRYGSVLQWSILLRTLAQTVSTALVPIVLRQYAQRDMVRLARTATSSVRLLGLTMALPIGLVVGFASVLIGLWLGQEFRDMSLLMRALTIHLCVNLAVLPLFSLQIVLNKVKWPGIVTVVLGVVNLTLAIAWVEWGTYGLGVAIAGAIVLTLKNAIYVPIYGARVQNLRWYTFILRIFPGLIATVVIAAISFALTMLFSISSWLSLISIGAVLGLVYLLILFFLVLTNEERTLLTSFLQRD